MEKKAKHIIFKGSVQGVGFRFTSNNIAKRYGVTGYVKNLPNGNVELLAQGDPDDIKGLIADLKESFRITDTEIKNVPYNSSYANFRIAF